MRSATLEAKCKGLSAELKAKTLEAWKDRCLNAFYTPVDQTPTLKEKRVNGCRKKTLE